MTQAIVPLEQLSAVLATADRRSELACEAGENSFSLYACETGGEEVLVSTVGLRRMTRTELAHFTQRDRLDHANRLLAHVFESMGSDRIGFRQPFEFEGARFALVPQVVLPQPLTGFLHTIIGTLQLLPPVFVEVVDIGHIGTGRSASQGARIGRMVRVFEPPESTALELHLMLEESVAAVDEAVDEVIDATPPAANDPDVQGRVDV